MGQLDGQRILISGSSRGIGAGVARVAREQGAEVILHGRTASAPLTALADELESPFIVCDATDADAVKNAVGQALATHGSIHALINSAGHVNRKPFLELTDADWHREFDLNLLGTAHFCQAVLPSMVAAQYGRIVNIASTRGHAHLTSPLGAPYSATKAAVISLSVALAKEFAPYVNVNSVSPGFTRTDQSTDFPSAVWDQVNTALAGRIGEPEEVAAVICFLAAPASSFVTGTDFLVDGGYAVSNK